MPDKERLIKAWEIFRDSNPYEICDGREFLAIKEPEEYCMGQMISDTIALLKEREAVKPIYNEEKYVDHLPHCGNCEKVLPNNAVYGKVNFCHYCGQAVKWDD